MAVPSEIPTPKTRTMDRCASFAHSHCGGSPSGPEVVQEYQYPGGSRAAAHRTSGTVYKTAVATPVFVGRGPSNTSCTPGVASGVATAVFAHKNSPAAMAAAERSESCHL